MAVVILLGAALSGCDYAPAALGGYTYRAEVGYHEGDTQKWYVGADKSRQDCTSEAAGVFNSMNRKSPGRAFSWACRKMQGERFLDRVR